MSQKISSRVESIDILRGLAMVLMALDHVRDYFHYGSFFSNPTDLDTTTPILFFTRFITHYCAPIFVFLAGASAFLYGRKKTKYKLFKFLFTRGLWLIFLEIVVNNFLWWFDVSYSFIVLQVIWAIGFSMICLSFLIYLHKKAILIIGFLLISGHNLLDGIITEGKSITSIIWYLMHQSQFLQLDNTRSIFFGYPAIPWIGLMALGYCFGTFYVSNYNTTIRKKWLLRLGIGAISLFFILRGINIYGDLVPWSVQKDTTNTVLSFLNVTKYPPSLAYLLITIGPSLLFLYAIENIKNRATNFFVVFGRVPLFYYFLHIIVIHLFAIIGILIFGGNWEDMILTPQAFTTAKLATYGYSLGIVYFVWIGIILLLYPLSKKYMLYKANNKDKWWLSYL